MVKQVKVYIEENGLLTQGDQVLVALSGGADSVCLLHVLLALRNDYALTVDAVHVNHRLRGAESDRDEAYCHALCERLHVKLHVVSVDVKQEAAARKKSIETAAREVRYAQFERLRIQYGYTKIATAHHAQDNAETILMHLLRGSGLDGLRGILCRRGALIRPLLCVEREQIEQYLAARDLAYVTDSTNLETRYARNRVRHDLLETLKQDYNPNLIQTFLQMSKLLCADSDYLNMQAKQACDALLHTETDKIILDAPAYLTLHEAIALRVMRTAIARCLHQKQDITQEMVRRCHLLCVNNKVGRQTCVGKLSARMEHGRLVLLTSAEQTPYSYALPLDMPLYVPEADLTFLAQKTADRPKETKHAVCFDAAKLDKPLTVRNRRDGDRVSLAGLNGSKKLKEYFIDAKITKSERDALPLVCAEDTVLWISGRRKTAAYAVDENTESFLKITCVEGKV